MIYIYYHIYAVNNCFDLVKKQLSILEDSITDEYKLDIVLLSGNADDKKSKNDFSKQLYNHLISKNYNVRKFVEETEIRNEWETLNCILEDKDKFNDDDYIFYFHTKGVTHSLDIPKNDDRDKWHRYNYEKFSLHWVKIMEYYLIKKYKDCIDILKNTNYNTVGAFLNEPMWYCEAYAGMYWWLTGKYAKNLMTKIDEKSIQKNIRSTSEFEFINSGTEWNPYTAFNIPYQYFTNEKFYNLIKELKNEN